jgi:hypothetical protein
MEQPLEGRLHLYSLEPRRLVAFESGRPTSDALIFIGGLYSGLATLPVLPQLHRELESKGWSLVQAVLSSSYTQWGRSSVDKDVEDINKLCEYLAAQGKKRIVLLGHSTGESSINTLVNFSSVEANSKRNRLPGELFENRHVAFHSG